VELGGGNAELCALNGELAGDGAQAAKLFGFEQARSQGRDIADKGATAGNGADDALTL
jgi:hypothetical protein